MKAGKNKREKLFFTNPFLDRVLAPILIMAVLFAIIYGWLYFWYFAISVLIISFMVTLPTNVAASVLLFLMRNKPGTGNRSAGVLISIFIIFISIPSALSLFVTGYVAIKALISGVYPEALMGYLFDKLIGLFN